MAVSRRVCAEGQRIGGAGLRATWETCRMRVEVLTIPDCPNGELAVQRTRAALAELGADPATLRVTTLTSDAAAANAPFSGSPTILRDGVDLFAGTRASALACRVYPSDAGPSGAPTAPEIVAALRAH